MSDKTIRLLSTFFYIGHVPVAPGTLASLAGALLAVALSSVHFFYVVVTIAVTVVGFQISGRMEEMVNQKDPSCVVIDEVAGVLIAFFLLPLTPAVMVTAFFLFRAFDMFKIYPVNKCEAMEAGTGIMMDDLVAGLYTNVVMQMAVRWSGII